MEPAPDPAVTQLRLRYSGACDVCGVPLAVGEKATFDRASKLVRCIDCSPEAGVLADPVAVDIRDRAGERFDQPELGARIRVLPDDPEPPVSWKQGVIGQERLVVAGSGVWVVHADRCEGRPTLRVERGIFRARVERLMVGRRDCTTLIDRVRSQVEGAQRALVAAGITAPVTGALELVDADWPETGGSFTTRGVHVLSPTLLQELLLAPGDLADLAGVRRALATHFPPA